MRPGRRTTPSRPASRRGSSHRGHAARSRSTSRVAARRAARRPRSPPNARPPSPPATRTRACRPSGSARKPDADRPAQDVDPGRRDLPRRVQGGGAGGPRDAGRRAIRRWSPYLEPADILVDGMRGRSAVWYRVRVNLIHVPEADRPSQEPLESDFDPWAGQDIEAWKAATAGSRARRPTPKPKAKTGDEGRSEGRAGARRPGVTPEDDVGRSTRSARLNRRRRSSGSTMSSCRCRPVSDEADARAFYVGLLGLGEVPKPADARPAAGGMLVRRRTACDPSRRRVDLRSGRWRRRTPALIVRDLDAATCRSRREPASPIDGRRQRSCRSRAATSATRSATGSSSSTGADRRDSSRRRPPAGREPRAVARGQPGAPSAATTARVSRSVRSASAYVTTAAVGIVGLDRVEERGGLELVGVASPPRSRGSPCRRRRRRASRPGRAPVAWSSA